jgi:hypothetical protein
VLTPYPQIVEYNEAVQNPATTFRDPELQRGRVKVNALGLPVALSGGFALTYMMATPRRNLAVRCFHREIPAAQQKYAALTTALTALRSAYFVGFDYLPDGIRIRGGWYPVVRMDWAEGDPLGMWLDRNSGNRKALEGLREQFAALAVFLERHEIAHGDIQNGNVIVSPTGLRLVDYDGVYVPGMPAGFGSESGHKHFQHPDRTPAHFGPTLDRFSFIAVDLSLAALIEDPSLYRRFRQGGETILFRANDFTDPDHAEVFDVLRRHPTLAEAAQNFSAVCRADFQAVPRLGDFRAGRNIPASSASVSAAPPTAHNLAPKNLAPGNLAPGNLAPRNLAPRNLANGLRPRAAGYIAPYPVLRAEDFAGLGQYVGQRVELVGRVDSIRNGLGERGRHRGKPRVSLNFAASRSNGVRVLIWAEDPALLRDAPDERWIGRCVSVVGLVEPPYVEWRFWSQHTLLGISTENVHEVEIISDEEMRFRLRRGDSVAPSPAAPDAIGTRHSLAGRLRDLAASLLGNETATRPVAVAAPAPRLQPHALPPQPSAAPPAVSQPHPGRRNQDIVRALRPSASPAAVRPVAIGPAATGPAATGIPRPQVPVRSRAVPALRMPQSGSFVIRPRSPVSGTPPRVAPAPQASSVFRRVLRFIGPDA